MEPVAFWRDWYGFREIDKWLERMKEDKEKEDKKQKI